MASSRLGYSGDHLQKLHKGTRVEQVIAVSNRTCHVGAYIAIVTLCVCTSVYMLCTNTITDGCVHVTYSGT